MVIDFSPSFKKKAVRLQRNLRDVIYRKIELFSEYPHHMGLRTHKLHGTMNGMWAFSINQKYRIIFRFISDVSVEFMDIGTHDVYE